MGIEMLKSLMFALAATLLLAMPVSAAVSCPDGQPFQTGTECSGSTSAATATQADVSVKAPPAVSTSVTSTNTGKLSDRTILGMKIALVVWGLIVIVSIYMHHAGSLTIYSDFTDASFTSLAIPLVAITYYLLTFVEVPILYAKYASAGLCLVLLLQVVRATITSNGIGLRALMALITKLTMIAAFYVILLGILGTGTTRRQGESASAYERRAARANKQRIKDSAIATGFLVLMSGWLCRNRGFISLNQYILNRAN